MSAESVRDMWRRKLEFLQAKEAEASDPEQKFQLHEAIAEAKAKLRELSENAGDPDDAILLVATSRLRHGAAKLVGREKELGNLDNAWDDPRTHVVIIVAWGG